MSEGTVPAFKDNLLQFIHQKLEIPLLGAVLIAGGIGDIYIAVAAQLGITRQTLYNKMKKYGL